MTKQIIPNKSSFYVYLIKETHKSIKQLAVKIGVTSNTDRRLAELQTGNSRDLVLFAKHGPFSEKKAYQTEKLLHKRLSSYFIRGEWFMDSCIPEYELYVSHGLDRGVMASCHTISLSKIATSIKNRKPKALTKKEKRMESMLANMANQSQ